MNFLEEERKERGINKLKIKNMTFYERLTLKRGKNPNSDKLLKLVGEKPIVKGLTKASIIYSDMFKIEYSGSDSHTFEEIDKDLKELNLPVLSKLKECFDILQERGHPDYYYFITFQI